MNNEKLNNLYKINLDNLFKRLKTQEVIYDVFYNAHINSGSKISIIKLYGKFTFLRDYITIRYGIKKTINFYFHKILFYLRPSALKIKLNLPECPMIFAAANGRVIVVISWEEKCIVKIEGHAYAKKFTEITKKSWETFKATEMEAYVPEYLDGGETEIPGFYYTKTRFCPNKPPLFRSFKGNAWPRVLASRVLPILQDFHTRNSFRLLDGVEWAKLISEKYENRKMPNSIKDALYGSLKKIKEFNSKLMPVGMISGDLQPQNIHFYQERTYILDWSNVETAALLIDVVCDVFYRAMSAHKEINSAAYWNFICGNRSLNQTPRVLQDFFKVWRQWVADWMGFQVDEQIYRLQLEGICWDWLGTMIHPWSPEDNSLWEVARFPDEFLHYCTQS